MKAQRLLFLSALLIACLIVFGCKSPENIETTEPLETTEEGDITKLEIKSSIAGWMPGNADDVSDTIGALVTSDTPVARDIAAKAIETALLTELEILVEHTSPLDTEDTYSARVALGFPILFELPIVGEKNYWVSVGFDFIIEDGEVVSANIDTSSFKMEASDK